MKIIAAIVLGWILNIACQEYAEFEHYDLYIDALNQGHEFLSGMDYVEEHRTKVLDYLLWKPNLWTCRWMFDHKKCLIPALLRSPLPMDQRGSK